MCLSLNQSGIGGGGGGGALEDYQINQLYYADDLNYCTLFSRNAKTFRHMSCICHQLSYNAIKSLKKIVLVYF